MTVTKTPNQSTEFYEMNPEKGFINIGSHPENDIVVQDPQILPFHMMLDLRHTPYHVIGLSPDANITVNGVPVNDGEAKEVMDLSQVRFCGFELNLQPGNGDGSSGKIAVVPPAFPSQPNQVEPLTGPDANAPVSGAIPAAPALPAAPMLQVPTSEVILVELQGQSQIIDVEQTAVYPITIINGGSIVASFEIQVEGVPADWVRIAPDRVNLNEGSRAGAEIQITSPRSASSRAGDYSVLIKVGSSNYPGQYGGVRAALTINPFFEFAVGNLSPRHKSVPWQKRFAEAHFPITNQGNSQTNYLVMAQDEENGCQFEFQMQDDVNLVKQAEVAVNPGETRIIPIRVTPQKRNLVRLRPRDYRYSVTTQSMNEGAASRIVSGSIDSRPLFGLLSILLAVALILVSAFFILRPRIIDFNVVEDVIALGDPAILNWKVSPFTTSLRIEGVNEPISGSQNQIEVVPNNTAATYTFVAGNWLSRLLRMEDVRSKPITVLSIPPTPKITTFFVDKTRIFEGDDVTIKWSVTDAEEAFLTVDGVRGALKSDDFNSERTVTLRNNSLIVLEAKNSSGSNFRSEFIHAQKPSIVIEEFSLSKTQITKGDPVTIKWKVSGTGVENVQIAPFKEVYPLEGELTFFPEASMEFVLTIKNRDLEEIRLLPIGVLEPGAEPEAPSVEFFKVAPEEIVGSGTVEFSWSVSGQFDKVEITNLDGVVATGLPAQGFKALNVEKTTSYVLTAYNGTLSSAAILEVKVSDTKKNVVVVIDKIVPSTSVNRGDPVTVYYSVTAATKDNVPVDAIKLGWPEISGSVVVTDGYDTCEPVDLPVHACILTLNTSDANKKIEATYSGDDNYVRRTSDPYPYKLAVIGEQATFNTPIFSPSSTVVGQNTTVSFEISPRDATAKDPITGDVNVIEVNNGVTTIHCTSTLTPIVNSLSAAGECTLPFDSVGTKSLTLKYLGNDIYDGQTTNTSALTVSQANTQTLMTANWATPTVVGEPLAVQVFVGPTDPGKGIPTGKVFIKDNIYPSDNCTITLNSLGKGECSLTMLHIGRPVITATYEGDINFDTSTAQNNSHDVIQASTTTSLTSFTPSTTSVGQQVVVGFQVKVVSPGSGSPSGTVTVTADNGDTCTTTINQTTGQGQCSVLLTKAGGRSFKGTYSGDTLYKTSEALGYSYPVTIAPTKTSIVSVNPSPSALNEDVKIEFSVELSQSSTLKPNGTAQVSDGIQTCDASVTEGVGNCNIAFASEGSKTLSVRFLGDVNGNYAASNSANVNLIVKKATSATILNVTSSAYTVDQPMEVKFSVIAIGGGNPPSGDVTVTSDDNQTCYGTLNNGNGSCWIANGFATAGNKTLTATYNGDNYYKGSTSDPYAITILKATTTTQITSSLLNATQVGESINVGFEVTSNITAKPTGSVTIKVDGNSDSRETCTTTITNGIGSCTLRLFQIGERSIWVDYAGTSNRFTPSISPSVKHTVNPAATTIQILSDLPDPSVVGEQVTFQVGVSANTLDSLRPTGSFQIIDTNTTNVLCGASLDTTTSQGSCSYTFTSAGTKSIKAAYSGPAEYADSASSTYYHTVEIAKTTTSITISPSTSYLNQQVTVTVNVSPASPGAGTPGGNVIVTASKTESDDENCSIINYSSSNKSCSLTLDAVGNWQVTAEYQGDTNFNTSTSAEVNKYVNKIVTTTTMTSVTPSPSVKGQPVTFTVRVAQNGAGSGTLGGTVEVTASKSSSIKQSCTIVDTSSGSGSCPITITLNEVGDWSVTAVYKGNDDFATSSSAPTNQIVNPIPTTTTISSITPSTSVAGQSINVIVNVARSGGIGSGTPSGTVKVTATKAGGSASCSPGIALNSGSGNCDLILPTAGEWTITAAYQGTTDFDSSSGIKTQTVNKADTETTVTLPSADPVVTQEITVSVKVQAKSPGSGTPTGTVTINATKSGSTTQTCTTATLSLGTGSCKIKLPAIGDWSVSGAYSGDDNFKTSTDSTGPITVKQASTSLSITSPVSSPSVVGNPVTVGFNLVVDSPGSGTPPGSVTVTATIKVSGTDYSETCTATGIIGQCNLTLSQVGTWKLSANYPGDSNYKAKTSADVNHTVSAPPTPTSSP